jgi:hypothetical protein
MISVILLKIFKLIGQIFTCDGQKCSLNSANFQPSHKKAGRTNSSHESKIFPYAYHIPKELEKISGHSHRFDRMNRLPLIDPFPRTA